MMKSKVASRHQARQDGSSIRDMLRQREMLQTSGARSGKQAWFKHRDGTSEMKSKQKGKQIAGRVKEIKRTDTYPDLRYLATGLWTYIITTGLPTGLPKWITVG